MRLGGAAAWPMAARAHQPELPVLGYRAFDSQANFVLFDGVADPAATFRALLERDILIRDVGLPASVVTGGP